VEWHAKGHQHTTDYEKIKQDEEARAILSAGDRGWCALPAGSARGNPYAGGCGGRSLCAGAAGGDALCAAGHALCAVSAGRREGRAAWRAYSVCWKYFAKCWVALCPRNVGLPLPPYLLAAVPHAS